jgi:LDH2 family malate/lactate/ureidoglycolate dehydrogenase
MMVELFCGLLGGTPAGKDCRQWRESHKAANLAQCFVAVDPECFAGDFTSRMQSFLDQNRQLKPVDPDKPVLVAGDPERRNEERCHRAGGLIYGQRQLDKLVRSSKLYYWNYLLTENNCRATENSFV